VAVAGSAIVTAVMAWYTRSLARRTRDMAEFTKTEVEAVVRQGAAIEMQAAATVDQVRLAQSALSAQVQPWLALGDAIDVRSTLVLNMPFVGSVPPLVVNAAPDRLRVSLAVRNVGNGLAIIDSFESYLIGWSDPREADALISFTRASVARPVLPPGEQARVDYDVQLERWSTDLDKITHRDRNYGEFGVDVVYGDVLGERRTRVRVQIAGTADNKWVVHRLDYYTPADAESPLISVMVG
jgi:hypothetical protein